MLLAWEGSIVTSGMTACWRPWCKHSGIEHRDKKFPGLKKPSSKTTNKISGTLFKCKRLALAAHMTVLYHTTYMHVQNNWQTGRWERKRQKASAEKDWRKGQIHCYIGNEQTNQTVSRNDDSRSILWGVSMMTYQALIMSLYLHQTYRHLLYFKIRKT